MTTNSDTDLLRATILAEACIASRVLAEAVRGNRAGGPLTGLDLVSTSDVTPRGLALAAVGALKHLIEERCARDDEKDADTYLADWLAVADHDEKAARARLAELTEGDDA